MTASEYDAELLGVGTELVVSTPLHLVVAPTAHTGHRNEALAARAARRTGDIVVAVAGLLVATPVLLAVVVAIRLDSKGPVLFRQPRMGRNGVVFTMLKFRTMGSDAELRQHELESHNESIGGVLFKMRADPRVTGVGRYLRKLNLDEIPQLVNVLRGDMSIVGPRPLPLRDSAILAARHPREYETRLEVRPGITGEWQVRRSPYSDCSNMLELDMQYLRARSLRHDGYLAGMTVMTLVKGILARRVGDG